MCIRDSHREELGGEYRFSTEGSHPIAALDESGTAEGTIYMETIERHARHGHGQHPAQNQTENA